MTKLARHLKASPTRARLADIASMAGVSAATVSRALTSPDSVKPKSLIAVQEAVNALGYVPNGAARALATQQSRTMGVITPTLSSALHWTTIHGFETTLEKFGYSMVLASFEYDVTKRFRQIEVMRERGVDALFLVSGSEQHALLRQLKTMSIPFLTTWGSELGATLPHIAYHRTAAASRLVRLLLDLGHQRIGVVTLEMSSNSRLATRVQLFRDILAEQGLTLADDDIVEVSSTSIVEGRQALQTLLSRGTPPTAILASNDILAIGILLECGKRNIAVPQELSVTGFGDDVLASQIPTTLTTIRPPSFQIGSLAATMLVEHVGKKKPLTSVVLDAELIVRESTGRPRPIEDLIVGQRASL